MFRSHGKLQTLLVSLVFLPACLGDSAPNEPVQAMDQNQTIDASYPADLNTQVPGETDGAAAPDTVNPPDDLAPIAPPEWWGEPMEGPTHQWQWVSFPGTFCADGSPTGLAINLSPGATKALIYFEGGGACWSYASCTGAIKTSFHLGGYDEKTFKGIIAEVYKNMWLFDRESPKNALSDAHYVFIPYCTGDAFAGDNVAELKGLLPWSESTVFFKGAHNVSEYLKRLVPTFANLDRVFLAGSSAGGFGAGFNWTRFQTAFGPTRVDVIDDSGPPISPSSSRWKEWVDAWKLSVPGCPKCTQGVDEMMNHFRQNALKTSKLGLLSYRNDSVISTFLNLLPWDFDERLEAMFTIFDEEPNAQYFVLPGALHTLLVFSDPDLESPSGIPLWYWIKLFVDDDPAWGSDAP